ncbi:MAG: cytochrome B [Gracilimonas sp.]|uniref:cytochrome B n=1 Tax=Gracilimonas TaxID=649462 RepID=UPI001B194B6C|nr:cytochrome B [Gracilimonas sp.]MBO6587039.1 cytochrome B [Gracilimonas sp.]MBO6614473.1 cytochrome B [Gracilimonas sp.]
MYEGLLHAHSGLRWIVLVLIVWALFKAVTGWSGKKDYQKSDRLAALLALIFTHIQLLIGLALYFISPKVSFESGVMESQVLRFYTVEHMSMMIIAIALITIGFSTAKRMSDSVAKYKRIAIMYGIGLLVIIASIPWPFRGLGAGWF